MEFYWLACCSFSITHFLYLENPHLASGSFPVIFILFIGLLAGLWEFPSLLQEDNSEDISSQKVLKNGCGLCVDTVLTSCHVGEVNICFC